MSENIYNNIKINFTKGNIPIVEKLLNKYSSVREIFDKENNNLYKKVELKYNIFKRH